MKITLNGLHKAGKLGKLGKGTKFLLLSSFLIPLSTFMFIPFLPIILNTNANLNFKIIGIILAFMSFIHFSGAFIGGFVADAIGEKVAMVVALFIRILAFLLFTFSNYNFVALFVSLILIAIGGALYMPANKGYLVKAVAKEERAIFLSISSAILNAGMIMGPLVGGLFIIKYTFNISVIISIIFVIILFIHIFFIKSIPNNLELNLMEENKRSFFTTLKVIFLIFLFNALTFYFYFFFQTFMGPFVSFYYQASIYSIILVINSLVILIFQPLLASFISKASFNLLVANSFILMGISFCFFFFQDLHFLVLGAICIAFAEAILFLKMELSMLDNFTHKPAVSFGYLRLSSGIGAALSGIIGGYLFSLFQGSFINNFWIIIMIKCFLVAIIVYIVHFKNHLKASFR